MCSATAVVGGCGWVEGVGGWRVWCLRVPRAPSPVSHLCTLLALGVHPRGQGFKGLLSAGAGKSKEYMAQKLAKQKVPFFR